MTSCGGGRSCKCAHVTHITHRCNHIPMALRSGEEEHMAREATNRLGAESSAFLDDGLGTGPGAAPNGGLVPRSLECDGDLLR